MTHHFIVPSLPRRSSQSWPRLIFCHFCCSDKSRIGGNNILLSLIFINHKFQSAAGAATMPAATIIFFWLRPFWKVGRAEEEFAILRWQQSPFLDATPPPLWRWTETKRTNVGKCSRLIPMSPRGGAPRGRPRYCAVEWMPSQDKNLIFITFRA